MSEWQIAKIKRARLGYEDHGILTCYLDLDYGGAGQSAGGFALDEFDPETKRRVGTAFGAEFIIRLLRAVGVKEWSQLEGRTIYALADRGRVYAIKPLPTELGETFSFGDLADEYLNKVSA